MLRRYLYGLEAVAKRPAQTQTAEGSIETPLSHSALSGVYCQPAQTFYSDATASIILTL